MPAACPALCLHLFFCSLFLCYSYYMRGVVTGWAWRLDLGMARLSEDDA